MPSRPIINGLEGLLTGGCPRCCVPADLVDKAGKYSEDVAVCGLILGVMALGYYLLTQRRQPDDDVDDDHQQHHHHQGLEVGQNAQREEVLQNK